MKTFTLTTDGGTTIELQAGMVVVVEIDGIDYEISIKTTSQQK